MNFKANYHTHTYRCGHASGDVADYCRAAVDAGLEVLGFSDHTPLPDGRWDDVRMDMDELPGYIRAIEAAQEAFAGRLTILKAVECEFDTVFESFYRDELLGRLGFDYLIAAAHWYPCEGKWKSTYRTTDSPAALRAYAAYVVRSMESGLFAFFAHPDLFGCAYHRWDSDAQACSRDILAAAEALQVPLEINGYGMIKERIDTPEGVRPMYPWDRFWELATEYDISVVVNSDAHRPENIITDMAGAYAVAERFGLKVTTLFQPAETA